MSTTVNLNLPVTSSIDIFDSELCSAFCSIKAGDTNYNQISIFVDRTPDSLIFLDQLRYSVDQAIKWARAK